MTQAIVNISKRHLSYLLERAYLIGKEDGTIQDLGDFKKEHNL